MTCEALLIGTLLIEMGIIEPLDGAGAGEILQNERRRYRLKGQADAADTPATQPSIEIGNIDPPELLQLPPADLSNRLQALRDFLEDKLAPKDLDPLDQIYSGSSAVECMLANGVVKTTAEGVMLSNLLVHVRLLVDVDHSQEGEEARNSRENAGCTLSGFRFMFNRDHTSFKARNPLATSQALVSTRRSCRETAIDAEMKQLEALLEQEEEAVAKEEAALEEALRELEVAKKETLEAMELSVSEKKSVSEARDELESSEFLLEARQVKLLSELKSIYPISRATKSTYAIRDLELPSPISDMKDDEVMAAALGYITHLLVMLSKYLQVCLRYKLEYSASRSAIRDKVASSGRDNLYPLYRRGVDNARFEQGLKLLECDIRQILWSRSLKYDEKAHMLKNLSELFENEIHFSV